MKRFPVYLSLSFALISCEEDVRKNPEITVSTFVGGAQGDLNSTGTNARLSGPGHIVSDGDGTLYFNDMHNHKIKGVTPQGEVFTVAGSSKGWMDGDASSAKFTYPYGIAIDSDGTLYVSDSTSIRKISPSGSVSTLAGNASAGNSDGDGMAASFNSPAGIAIDHEGNLYVADMNNSVIRKVTPSGAVTTLAGGTPGYKDGMGSAAQFDHPAGIEIGPDTALYIADSWNHRIRKVTLSGEVTTVAGNGEVFEGTSARSVLLYPMDITLDAIGNFVIADGRGSLKMANTQGTVTDIAGQSEFGYVDGDAGIAKFGFLMGIALGDDGSIYACDNWNHAIRKINFD